VDEIQDNCPLIVNKAELEILTTINMTYLEATFACMSTKSRMGKTIGALQLEK